ncbi:MAG TPA: hypothetical protein VK849_14060 [Longimicrobiales bacterium]|nr:hypothetical protein [Longimicrobiales bacterium]
MTRADGERAPRPERVIGVAIQDMAAARLGRAFVPLVLLLLTGLGEVLGSGSGGSSGLVLALGAPLAGGAMLAHGQRIVQEAFGRPHRPWMTLAALGSVLPPALGVYVLGWRGLRGVAAWQGAASVLAGIVLTVLGAWLVRAWLRLMELQRLAEAMGPVGPDEGRGGA